MRTNIASRFKTEISPRSTPNSACFRRSHKTWVGEKPHHPAISRRDLLCVKGDNSLPNLLTGPCYSLFLLLLPTFSRILYNFRAFLWKVIHQCLAPVSQTLCDLREAKKILPTIKNALK